MPTRKNIKIGVRPEVGLPYTKDYPSRNDAQTDADTMRVEGTIDLDEWSRLTDLISNIRMENEAYEN